jgi:hypothetical protein
LGRFDYVKFEVDCPSCGSKVADFQTKDGERLFETLEPFQVNNFYSRCDCCGSWIEFNAETPGDCIGNAEWRGIQRGLEAAYRLLLRQIHRRFGETATERSIPVLEQIQQPTVFEDLGEALLDCTDAATWLRRLKAAAAERKETRKFVMTVKPPQT